MWGFTSILRTYLEEYESSNFNVFGNDIYSVILDITLYKIPVDICHLYRYIRDLNYKSISDLYKSSLTLFSIFQRCSSPPAYLWKVRYPQLQLVFKPLWCPSGGLPGKKTNVGAGSLFVRVAIKQSPAKRR